MMVSSWVREKSSQKMNLRLLNLQKQVDEILLTPYDSIGLDCLVSPY